MPNVPSESTALDFNFQGHTVRTVIRDGEPWFALTDLCRVLEVRNPSDVAARLDDDMKGVDQIETPGGRQKMTVVNEVGMYEVVLRSDKPQAAAFRRWITSEVIPTIRKTGSYGKPAELTRADLARLVLEAEAELEQAKQEIKALEPKRIFADAVAASRTDILVGELAKILRGNGVEVGQNRLFEELRRDGYLISRRGSDWNMPTQRSMELGLFRIKETVITHSDGHTSISKTAKVTGKGQQYFITRYLNGEVAA